METNLLFDRSEELVSIRAPKKTTVGDQNHTRDPTIAVVNLALSSAACLMCPSLNIRVSMRLCPHGVKTAVAFPLNLRLPKRHPAIY